MFIDMNKLRKITNYIMYKNSLVKIKFKINNVFLATFLHKPVIKKNENFMYKNIYTFLSDLPHNTFCMLTINHEFDLYDFVKYTLYTNKYIKTIIEFETNNKAETLIGKDTLWIMFTEEKGFLDLYKKRSNLDNVYTSYANKNCIIILFTTEPIEIKDKSIILENFVSTLFAEIKLYNYLKLVINKLFNSGIYVYNTIDISKALKANIFGQDKALDSILLYANNLNKKYNFSTKPIGSWLLCGPSGTGKTALAKILAYSLFGSLDNLIKIDMSEYSERASVAKLIGSPAGYSGHGDETILSRHFLQSSSFVVLFDEIEKAHKSVLDIMLQLLDEGRLKLATGKILNFNSSFILFTSNLGYTKKDNINKTTQSNVMEAISDFFRAELLNRINAVILFDPITESSYLQVFKKFIKEASIKFDFYLDITDELKLDLIKLFYNKSYGSRPLKRVNIHLFNFVNAMYEVLKYRSSGKLSHLWNLSEYRAHKLL